MSGKGLAWLGLGMTLIGGAASLVSDWVDDKQIDQRIDDRFDELFEERMSALNSNNEIES